MRSKQSGFTLLEMLVVLVGIGIVSAIAAPNWFGFLEANRLTVSRDKLYLSIRDAQIKAQRQRTPWQFSLRERGDVIEWAIHPKSISPSVAQWESLEAKSIRIDDETTFANSGGIYYVRFDEKGNVQYRLGRITLSGQHSSSSKRCVIVSTLIGAMRKAQQQPTPNDGKFCY